MRDARAPVQPPAARAGALEGRALPALLIVAAGFLAYAGSFDGVFVFDDIDAIVESPDLRQWRDLGTLLSGSRPLVQLTLGLNYALGGLAPWGYHLFNVTAHVLAAVLLFGVLRRLLRSAPMAEGFGEAASGLALAAALLWTVHPLQTGAVTYVIQRAESMVGLLYLATLYASMRCLEAARAGAGGAARRWGLAAAAACLAGAATKPVIASAPVIVLLYDRTFVWGSFRAALRRSWGLYAALAVSWPVVAWLTLAYPDPVSAGFSVRQFTPWQYAVTQCAVLTHYLTLTVWPVGLCLDYSWPPATPATVWPQAGLIVALIGATLWLTWRRSPVGFAGMWFFLVLAPTSSIMPLADACFEHRMYLPLAAVVALGVAWAWRLIEESAARAPAGLPARRAALRNAGWAVFALVFVLLALLTHLRNREYGSETEMWRSVLRAAPDGARAHCHLGTALAREGDIEGAIAQYREALRLAPEMPRALYNLGTALALRGEYGAAAELLRRAAEKDGHFAPARQNLGAALARLGRVEEAAAAYREAVRLMPTSAEAHRGLAAALARTGRRAEAEQEYRRALELWPDWPQAREEWERLRGP
jgi:Flp pilus assembly protein TadD